MWSRIFPTRWDHPDGRVIIKWGLTGQKEYLLYQNLSEIEYGDYKPFKKLRDAKNYDPITASQSRRA